MATPGTNDLATTHPYLAVQADGWDATTVCPGSHQKMPWRCPEKNHRWLASVYSRSAGNGCPYCSGRLVSTGVNDLKTLYPEIAKQMVNHDPSSVLPFSNKKIMWECERGHYYEATPNNRVQHDSGCPVCANRSVLTGFNDLETLFPDVAKEAYGWDPKTALAGSNRSFGWRCQECGHIWKARMTHRTYSGSGCPECVGSGYQMEKPGYVYLISHPQWGLTKIGISNRRSRRIEIHAFRGWELLETIGPLSGEEAHSLEQSILRFIRSKGVPRGCAPDGSKFDGYTESWPTEKLIVSSIQELRTMANS